MNRQIILQSRPSGMPVPENFSMVEIPVPSPAEGELLVKAKFISVDPYMRGRMNDSKSYIGAFETGKPINGGIVARVTESRHPGFKEGDAVIGAMSWQEIQVVKADQVSKIDMIAAPLSYHLGILGMPGMTAYFGLLDIGKPKAGETVVVSGAAGAVGTVVCQIARIKGSRVVGIAGNDEKTNWLKNEIGVDETINYRSAENLQEALSEACPNGVDVYFDNVGGEISDAVMTQINKGARIIICGQISLYNATQAPTGPRVQPILLGNTALMQGFLVRSYSDRYPEAVKELSKWIKDGKLKYRETISKGFETLPNAFIGLFRGENTGKYLVEVE